MSERYWITGVQLGMLRTVKTPLATRVDIVEEIIDKQFLGTKDKLVPVVSLQALKEWCKEEMDGMDRTDDFERGIHDILEELIYWAEKQAVEKK